MVGALFGSIIVICLFMSFYLMFRTFMQRNFLSFETVLSIVYLYVSLLIGFGMIYLILLQSDIQVLKIGEEYIEGAYFERLGTCLYFSTITLFSVGYGDIVPVSFGRFIASIQALIGYTLPAVFVARTVMDKGKKL
ncbi:ion channel [Metabacillus fastidiosus]|uniref:ion channel n=1 Tax=Metabacillus fastidiosus TaxID=1458 RepID=UPI003D2862B7